MGFVRGLGNNVYVLMLLKRGTSIIYPSWLQQGALVRVASNGVAGQVGQLLNSTSENGLTFDSSRKENSVSPYGGQ